AHSDRALDVKDCDPRTSTRQPTTSTSLQVLARRDWAKALVVVELIGELSRVCEFVDQPKCECLLRAEGPLLENLDHAFLRQPSSTSYVRAQLLEQVRHQRVEHLTIG